MVKPLTVGWIFIGFENMMPMAIRFTILKRMLIVGLNMMIKDTKFIASVQMGTSIGMNTMPREMRFIPSFQMEESIGINMTPREIRFIG